MAVLIIIAIIIIAEVVALVYLSQQRRKAQKRAASEVTQQEYAPVPDLTSTTPEIELTISPEVAESSTLPEEAKSLLMNAVWYRCENPKCNFTQFLDVYHIVPEDKEGTNTLDNLIVLCPTCRAAAKNSEITEEELRSWVKGRIERFKFALDWPYR